MLRRRKEASGRAQRFPIRVPIRYRIPRSRDWFEAYTENVSRSGVLFRAECDFEPTTTLDLRLELPPINNKDGLHAEVVCKGEVVRMDPSDGQQGTPPGVAVAIHRYWMTQKREPN